MPFLKKMQSKNSKLISSLTDHIVDKLDRLDFKQIIDRPVNVLNQQMSAYAACAKVTETFATKQKATFLENAGLTTSATEEDIAVAKVKHLFKEFSKQPICHPVIKDNITNHNASVKKIWKYLERTVVLDLLKNPRSPYSQIRLRSVRMGL